jgi:hypothetical protein
MRGDQQRQAMVRAADAVPRNHAHAPARQQPGPFRNHVLRIGRQAVGRVVDDDQHFDAVDGQDVLHDGHSPDSFITAARSLSRASSATRGTLPS